MKLNKIIRSTFILAVLSLGMFWSFPAFAADPDIPDICGTSAPDSVKEAAGCGSNANALPDIIVRIINAVILVLGIVAVIFVVIGGVNYMTSAGDPGKVQKARSTILYAIIGLIVCALAFAIVNFVIYRIS